MKKLLTTILFVSCALMAQAQYTPYVYDIFNYSQHKVVGTARMQGIGGTYSSLGADATSVASNPAGLGFYNRSEFSVTPVFSNSTTTSTYIDQASSWDNSKTSIGQLSLVFSNKGVGTRKKRSTFGIGYTRLVDFATDFNYVGSNNKSSLMDAFAERATNRGASSTTLDSEFDTDLGTASSPEALYYQTFMIDPIGNGEYVPVELSAPVLQDGRYTESGGVNQWNLSYGINYDDKTYIGASLGIQSLNYGLLTDHREVFPKGEVFNSFDYYDDLTVQGAGLNLSVGAIIKATKNVQFGINVSTPTAMSVTETYYEGISISQKPNTFTTDYPQIETAPSDYNLRMTTPLRGNVGTTVFLPKKLGFVSADIEYVGYKGMNVKDPESTRWSSDQRTAIQELYKSTINWKVGSELRFGKARVRGGVNYLASPYQQVSDVVKTSQLITSLGGGYRTERFFLDAALVSNRFEGSYTPYTLSNAANYASAALDTKRSNFVISVGAYF